MQVLQSVLPIKDEEVVLGQYEGYRDDPTVPDHSNTPTFATMVLRIHNERWEGVIHGRRKQLLSNFSMDICFIYKLHPHGHMLMNN